MYNSSVNCKKIKNYSGHAPEMMHFPSPRSFSWLLLALPGAFFSFCGADTVPDPAVLTPIPEAYRAGFVTIAEAPLQAWLKFLASEELEGRGTAQPGYTLAARFCASVFEQYGLSPAGGTVEGKPGYFQEFNWLRLERDPES